MKNLIPLLSLIACTSFAEVRDDIDVVPCNKILKADKVPSQMMPKDITDSLKASPDNWVCFYAACDFEHQKGWTAIHKTEPMIFSYSKENKKPVKATVYEKFEGALCHKQINKYGVETYGCVDMEIDFFKRILLTDDVICTEK